mmetsp:Transcript_60389/g.100246  ORF Transcript_60389/g.100246 Transcript_60389/m.100246 type:complete len:283 (-) Transcript_60389:94-942(-)|eukprot:CAMPEP_0119313514 /NCGR_PEP_ID=MMETSP1333-20130426/29346_1 /TAXON_ID=418940 /ORGANISM="Scyphosphaera apsteinii, Strain RCC1455" /LENGTH=282 /DNA_ID=CAMNT_0007318365 /DNA_START=84 /DNA_END=932 /DNA_ORIENTATION=+
MITVASFYALALCVPPVLRIPQSPDEMVQRAAMAVVRASKAGVQRQVVKVVVPDDLRTYKVFGAVEISGTSAPEDLDPWPGGLKQQFPIALALGRSLLQGATGASESAVTDQVLDAEDACGLILAQGNTPAEDAACVLFAGTDQLGQLEQVDKMAEGRLLCLLNPQFRRLQDFSLWQRGKAKATYFDRDYQITYSFEELACRGEDITLVHEYGLGWQAFIRLDDQNTEGLPLHEGCLPERPDYKWLEAQINAQHPQPRWARMLNEVDTKGLRFMRDNENLSG